MPTASIFFEFQSAPAIAGGRCTGQQRIKTFNAVSIRARHRWRALQVEILRTMGLNVFQSAPAIAGGRCAKPI